MISFCGSTGLTASSDIRDMSLTTLELCKIKLQQSWLRSAILGGMWSPIISKVFSNFDTRFPSASHAPSLISTDRLGPLSHSPTAGNEGSVFEERREDNERQQRSRYNDVDYVEIQDITCGKIRRSLLNVINKSMIVNMASGSKLHHLKCWNFGSSPTRQL